MPITEGLVRLATQPSTQLPEIDIMNSIQKSLAAIVVAAFGLGLASSAGARSTVAWAGSSNPLVDVNCFTESYGTVTAENSSCGPTLVWEIALPVDTTGTKTVTANVTPGTSSSMSCIAYSVNQSGTEFASSGQIYATGGAGVSQNVNMTVLSVPSAGSLFTACFFTDNDRFNTVNWTP
jgi:hypothetical protein